MQIVCKEVSISTKVISKKRNIKSKWDYNSRVPTRFYGKRLVKARYKGVTKPCYEILGLLNLSRHFIECRYYIDTTNFS